MAGGQPEAPEDTPPGRAPAGDIVLHSQPGRPLTKAQQAFNRLVARVEKLRAKLDRERRRLDEALAYYGEHLHPRERRIAELRKETVRLLAGFLDDKRLKAKRDRAALRDLIAAQLDMIAQENGGLQDAALQALFERVHGMSVAEMEADAFAQMKSMMQGFFSEAGVDLDLSGIRPGMTEAEMAESASDVAEQLREAQEARAAEPSPRRRKTKRQLEREARVQQAEELRRKSIASIYKQLAKALHPDLEQDPESKREKSALMQELTAAYRNNDLHTLLRLELAWIHREEADLARLTDEKLGVYNQLLKEQAAELDLELRTLPSDPRYEPIAVPFGSFSVRLRTDGPAEAYQLDLVVQSIEVSLARLQSGDALQEVRDAIRDHRASQRHSHYDVPF